jgi:hypothetical protein
LYQIISSIFAYLYFKQLPPVAGSEQCGFIFKPLEQNFQGYLYGYLHE